MIHLHETTDTDNSAFRSALAARDGVEHTNWHVPGGFYLVGDAERPTAEFHAAVIEPIEKVTHIAPPADDGKIIGDTVEHWDVTFYPARKAALCMGLTNTDYVGTTEVYPYSPTTNPESCIEAQVASVMGTPDYLLESDGHKASNP